MLCVRGGGGVYILFFFVSHLYIFRHTIEAGIMVSSWPSVFTFPVISFENINEFSPNDMCIDIVEIEFGIANWLISSILTELSARHMVVAGLSLHVFYLLLF